MWASGDDYSEEGEAVKLYHPITYGGKPTCDSLTTSFIGGTVSNTPACASCRNQLHLLAQLYVPQFRAENGKMLDRTLRVFACNRASCVDSLFTEFPFQNDGGGIVCCQRLSSSTPTTSDEIPAKVIGIEDEGPSWTKEAPSLAKDADDWGTGGDSTDIEELEAKLARLEASPAPSQKSKTKEQHLPPAKVQSRSSDVFPCFELHSSQEPAGPRSDNLDDDDVGISGSDFKIEQMLAKYMDEEEDESILAALRGSGSSEGGPGGRGEGGGERDERLSAADRVMLQYTDRLKRSSRQVLRYALQGEPLWSIPIHKPQATTSRRSRAPQSEEHSEIPKCSCGADRVFEFQLVSTILHVLEVDKKAELNAKEPDATYQAGGMNFGNVAIYSCPNACTESDVEFVVVQKPLDEGPRHPPRKAVEDALITEDSKFDLDEDDEMEDDPNDQD